MREDNQILSTPQNVECMAGSASLGKNYDYVLANIYHNPYAGNSKLSGVLYCVEVKGNSTVVTIKSLNRFSSNDLSYEGDKRWNGEWVGNLISSNITSGQSRREKLKEICSKCLQTQEFESSRGMKCGVSICAQTIL